MRDFTTMTTDELHTWLQETSDLYDEVKKDILLEHTLEPLIEALGTASRILRARHELWIKLDTDELLKRYRMGMISCPIDTVMDEWQEEIKRRGLPLPIEAWPDESEAHYYWYQE